MTSVSLRYVSARVGVRCGEIISFTAGFANKICEH